MNGMAIDAIVHHEADDVAVVVLGGLDAGAPLRCWSMDRDEMMTIVLRQAVSFGHKVALRAIAEGERVMKYGSPIGAASAAIEGGDHVHVHNLRSSRW